MNRDGNKDLEQVADQAAAEGKFIEALRTYDRIIGTGAATATTWQKTGEALVAVNEFAQAIGAFEKAVQLDDSNPAAHHNLAKARYTLGEVDHAVIGLKKAARLTTHVDPWLALATIIPNAPSATPQEILEIRQTYAEKIRAISKPATPPKPRRPKGGRVRIGYLSAHFCQRNYMKPVWALINHHDRSRYELHLLSDSLVDDTFSDYRTHSQDSVHDVSQLTNRQLAYLTNQLRLDVLVDLSAYSHTPRVSFFANRLAPIVVAWFNMYATSGLPAIDYLIGDRHVVDAGEEADYSESIIRLPLSYLTFQVDYPVPDIARLPCLHSGEFTFGSLVSQYKLTEPTVDAWSAILRQCPASRLVLANSVLKSPHNRNYVIERFQRRGIAGDQLRLLPPADHRSFLQYYDQIDLALDSFPYSGGTTTMEAIWQGVPVLTHEGDRWAARTSKTLLRECHLSEFVAGDVRDYVEKAVGWAHNRSRWSELARLRSEMRATLSAHSVCDGAALAGAMENVFEQLLARHR